MGRVGELRISHMLGSRYGDSLRLIIGVLRCWAAMSPEKHRVWGLRADSLGPCLGTSLFSVWRPLPWLLSHGPPPSYPSFFLHRSKGKLSPRGLGGAALGDRLCGPLFSHPGPRGKVPLCSSEPEWVWRNRPQGQHWSVGVQIGSS